MKNLINQINTNKRTQLFALMCIATGFDFLMIIYRLYYINFDFAAINRLHNGQLTFLFLIWNLFLAWIPYWIAIGLPKLEQLKFPKIAVGIGLVLWLLFFPNAPYIITDLLHIRMRPPVPLWYDVLLIFSFAWTGLMLGLLSLYEIERYLTKYLSKTQVQLFLISVLFLCGLGIFIGRFQRWNSWDIVANPLALIRDICDTILHPAAEMNTFGITFVLFGFLTIGYWVLKVLLAPDSSANSVKM